MNSRKTVLAVALVLALATAVYAAVYSYRYAVFNIQVDNPAVWFEDPGVPGVNVTLYRRGTSANITVNALRTLLLEHRSAVYYDTFDTNPFTAGRLQALTCTWLYNTTANATSISASARSNTSWSFWCVVIVNPAVLNITPYVLNGSTIYVAFLGWRSVYTVPPLTPPAANISVSGVYLNATAQTPTFHTIGYQSILHGGRTGESVSSNITLVTGTTVTRISTVHLGNLSITEHEFIYHVTTAIDFARWVASHYVNETYIHVSAIGAGYRWVPYAVGFGYWVNRTDVSGTFFYDNLIVTVNHPPWYVNVTGVPDGWIVVLKNATGYVVANTTSIGGVARLVVAMQRVVDALIEPLNRNAFIFPNAIIEVYDTAGRLVYSTRLPVVLGGDRYRFVSFFEGVVLSVYSNATHGLWFMLANATATYTPLVNASIGLVAWNGTRTPVNVTVINGIVVVPDTTVIYVDPPPAWTTKWLVANVTGRFELPVFTVFNIRLYYIWWISDGVKVFYDINITAIG